MGRPKGAPGSAKKAKDPNKPKRATSAYFFFLAACREEAKREGRSISQIAQFTKECSARWKMLNDSGKKPFEDQAAQDKARYEHQMSMYGGKAKKDPTKPKRPQSAYFCFLAEFRKKMAHTATDHKDILRKAGEAWRNMDENAKRPFEKMSQGLQSKYEQQMEQWRKGGSANGSAAAASASAEDEEDDDEEDESEEDDE